MNDPTKDPIGPRFIQECLLRGIDPAQAMLCDDYVRGIVSLLIDVVGAANTNLIETKHRDELPYVAAALSAMAGMVDAACGPATPRVPNPANPAHGDMQCPICTHRLDGHLRGDGCTRVDCRCSMEWRRAA